MSSTHYRQKTNPLWYRKRLKSDRLYSEPPFLFRSFLKIWHLKKWILLWVPEKWSFLVTSEKNNVFRRVDFEKQKKRVKNKVDTFKSFTAQKNSCVKFLYLMVVVFALQTLSTQKFALKAPLKHFLNSFFSKSIEPFSPKFRLPHIIWVRSFEWHQN